ncbi:hypothetical protein FZEAL_1512 [Fusarium zealandicum]|uniref:Uncharacterized protein n=1 Tax=Fusarium zealandicum TaxID=1053134 RepID=A0A8H4XNP8_9HYPO|nr:hypothetical protein FZEAL_1512 [Fusarium zealandicum]
MRRLPDIDLEEASTRSASRPAYSMRSSTRCFSRILSQPCRSLKWVFAMVIFISVSGTIYLAMFTSRLDHVFPSRHTPEPVSRADLESLVVPHRSTKPSSTRHLRLFMSADSPHLNLCKTIMSAVALGYPMPTLLNWNREYNRPSWHFGGSHIAKLESLLGGIEALLEDADDDAGEDDIAILVDAYDLWFQLPPSVLLQRYHQLNSEADARVRKQWADLNLNADFPISPPRQDIIITTAKDCFPDAHSGSDPRYQHWPESPMPKDMYGEGTDHVSWSIDPARKHRKVRPRCVNSGIVMGSLGALRDTLRRCKEKIDSVAMNGRQLWSDQALIGEALGDQEIWREWARHLGASWNGSIAHNDRTSLSPAVRSIADAALLGRRFEFGIGLDYNFTTVPPTCSSEEDGYFVRLSNDSNVRAESDKAGVPGEVRVHGVPPELRNTRDRLLFKTDWGSVPLYTDFFFGVTPVGIHHNAYVGGLKAWRLRNWWDKMWYYPQLRDLITQRLKTTSGKPTPLAEVEGDDKERIVYWAPREDQERKMASVFSPLKPPGSKFEPIGWDGVCQKKSSGDKWYDELFGDGKGPLDAN